MTVIPELRTERLLLRAPRPEDFEAHSDTLMTERGRFIGGPFDREDAWRDFAADAGSWVLRGFGYWAVEDSATGAFAAWVGLARPAHFPERELGWLVHRAFEGRGVGFEAAGAARDHALETLGWPALVSYIDAENRRSIRLAERLGAVRDDAAARPDPEDLVYRHRSRAEGGL